MGAERSPLDGVNPFDAVNDAFRKLPTPRTTPLVSEQTPDYSEPPGESDVFDSIVQEREGEGGFFVQTAGVHRADVLLAFAELAAAEAEALEDEHDGPPREHTGIGETRRNLEDTVRVLSSLRHDVTH